jgi:hypothetical protein
VPTDNFIISLWRDEGCKGFLCTGLLLSEQYVLTVKHTFKAWSDDQPVFVGMIDGVHQGVVAHVLQRHQTYDAAVLRLQTAVKTAGSPPIQAQSSQSFDGRPATLWVIDPDTYSRSPLPNGGVGNFDHHSGEYVIYPENARGHSGGVVDVEGRVIGLFSRRKTNDPLARATAMHLLWPWLQGIIAREPVDQTGVSPPTVLISTAYIRLVEKVRDRVRRLLMNPGTENLVSVWGSDDPLAGFDLKDPASQLDRLMKGLYLATRDCHRRWQRDLGGRIGEIKHDCLELWSELAKLAVNPSASDAELAAVAAGSADQLFLACQYGGTAEAVYCALRNLSHVFGSHEREQDVVSDLAVRLSWQLPSGLGEDERQEVLKKLWDKVMDAPLPAKIDGKHYDQLVVQLNLNRDWENRQFLLVAKGPWEWCNDSDYRRLADELHVGLVLRKELKRGEGQCAFLLLAEEELIGRVRHYLQLLERL